MVCGLGVSGFKAYLEITAAVINISFLLTKLIGLDAWRSFDLVTWCVYNPAYNSPTWSYVVYPPNIRRAISPVISNHTIPGAIPVSSTP